MKIVLFLLIFKKVFTLDINECNDLIGFNKNFLTNFQFFNHKNINNYLTLYKCNKFKFNDFSFRKKTHITDLYTKIKLKDYLRSLKKNIVYIIGNNLDNKSKDYKDIAFFCKKIEEKNYLIITNGIEACHLGTWFSGRSIEELYEAIDLLNILPIEKIKIKYPRLNKGIDIVFCNLKFDIIPTSFASYIVRLFNEDIIFIYSLKNIQIKIIIIDDLINKSIINFDYISYLLNLF